ncbi:hypothetical protein DFH07DRAFT_778728 [Mycena maculata]|uniref:Uncharacterized protein n=1 Tax=Mycena maculata TaxID=230809 RepID=A0AAD7MZS7_9AGAR|nr:hypothetical protein DFH07DRAFT_778728 [Mycena maculata]
MPRPQLYAHLFQLKQRFRVHQVSLVHAAFVIEDSDVNGHRRGCLSLIVVNIPVVITTTIGLVGEPDQVRTGETPLYSGSARHEPPEQWSSCMDIIIPTKPEENLLRVKSWTGPESNGCPQNQSGKAFIMHGPLGLGRDLNEAGMVGVCFSFGARLVTIVRHRSPIVGGGDERRKLVSHRHGPGGQGPRRRTTGKETANRMTAQRVGSEWIKLKLKDERKEPSRAISTRGSGQSPRTQRARDGEK